jgi:L-alanine-DL-glutamate epimerase-like enolase superfamily enzyme
MARRDTSSLAVRPRSCALYLLPVTTRVPLKFGAETLTEVVCARVRLTVEDVVTGNRAEGWGETPLSVQWVWPSALPYAERLEALQKLCVALAREWTTCDSAGHPIEVGYDFQQDYLLGVLETANRERRKQAAESIPWLAALVCCSPFDIALHDAYGNLLDVPVYLTYARPWMARDLAQFFGDDRFRGKYPADFLATRPASSLPAWHLVGGLDPLTADDLTGAEPDDGYPILLADWIRRDGLKCLKVKLRGTDARWDYDRLVRVGELARMEDVTHLSADFNCTVREPAYVNDVLDRLQRDRPEVLERLLYVEQPFGYELEKERIDVRSVASRKPLFLDESAHDWRMVELGRTLGWNGVALKTCKTQTGALLSLAWARQHGMQIMVQDLTNPMLAMLPHALLAAHAGTIMGVETNAPQFYPDASTCESRVHPGLYRRRGGAIDLSSIRGSGLGYRLDEVQRTLPEPVFQQ